MVGVDNAVRPWFAFLYFYITGVHNQLWNLNRVDRSYDNFSALVGNGWCQPLQRSLESMEFCVP
jgi:hypothetical protein